MVSGENKLLDAILSRAPVEGLTHDFYRYPARFSRSWLERSSSISRGLAIRCSIPSSEEALLWLRPVLWAEMRSAWTSAVWQSSFPASKRLRCEMRTSPPLRPGWWTCQSTSISETRRFRRTTGEFLVTRKTLMTSTHGRSEKRLSWASTRSVNFLGCGNSGLLAVRS